MDQKIEPRTDREILISMNAKVTNLCEHLRTMNEKVESDEGFPRCIHKDERIKDVEEYQKTISKILVGISVIVGGTAIVFIVKFFWDHISMAAAMANNIIF